MVVLVLRGPASGGSPEPNGCAKIVNLADGSIVKAGISLNANGAGIIGETFWLNPDCRYSGASCIMRIPTPQANFNNLSGFMQGPPNLVFAPGQVGTSVTAVPSCAAGDDLREAIAGCDSPTNYTCGLPPGSGGTNAVDLRENPDAEVANGVSCLIHQGDVTTSTDSTGQDYLNHNLNFRGAL